MSALAPKRVVIVGRDIAAWLSANALHVALAPAGITVDVVELPGQLRALDVALALPAVEALHRLLGFDENEVLKATSGAYSLGQSFANFARTRRPFFHPYGSVGNPINRLPFIQFWIKAQQAGLNADFEDFSVNAAAAKLGRFFIPTNALGGFGRFDYGYHLRAVPYANYLKAQALRRGVRVHASRRVDTRLHTDTGHITSVILSDGAEVAGDLFIDTSGAESVLLGGALQTPFESWENLFPDNRVLAVAGEQLKSQPAFAQVRALTDSCLHLAPVQDMTGILHVYHDEQLTDDAALQVTAQVAGLRLQPDATVSPLHAGRRTSAWVGNCVGIGEAACVFNPIDSPGLYSIHVGLAHLIGLFPVDDRIDGEAAEYNRQIRRTFERVRDFQLLHGRLNCNFDVPYWDYLRRQAIPDELAHKIDMFEARGIVPLYDDETFQLDSFQTVMIGHGLMPKTYDPIVDQTPDEVAIDAFKRMLNFIREQVQQMSSHGAHLELYAAKDFL